MTALVDEQRLAPNTARWPDDATADQVLSHIDALVPMVTQLAPEIERARRLPAEFVSALRSTRIYGMFVPRRYGGLRVAAQHAAAHPRHYVMAGAAVFARLS